MNLVLKLAALAAGGYLAYEWFFAPATAAAAASSTSTAPTTPAQAAASTTLVLVAAAAKAAGYDPNSATLDGDEWNYYYSQVRGVPGPDPTIIWPNRDRSYKMSISEWWAGVSAAGVSGLGGLGNYVFTRFL